MVCAASGPSLTRAQLARVRGHWPVVVVNDSWRLAPWADVLYACDWRWWRKHGGVPAFHGLKVTLSNSLGHIDAWPEIKVLRNTGTAGLERSPSGLRTGRNSGYQAINLAVHFGVRRIVLLGYDMKPAPDGRTHWFGDHADWPTRPGIFETVFQPYFQDLARELAAGGVEIINCTLDSALDAFPRRELSRVIAHSLTG